MRLSKSEVANLLSAFWYAVAEVLPTLVIDDPMADEVTVVEHTKYAPDNF